MRDIKFAFTGGEFDPRLHGRSDLERYALGAAKLENFAVSYAGTAVTRYPLRFVEFSQHPDQPIRFFAFEFSNSLDNAYLVIFGAGWIRFVRDGGYILEAPKNVTSVASGLVNSAGHGYSDGDLIYLENQTQIFVVASAAPNSYVLKDIDGNSVSVSSGATTSKRVFTLTHPYAGADLATLKADQVFDQIKFTHTSYPVMLLTRTANSWTFEPEVRNGGVPLLGIPTGSSSGRFIRSVRVLTKGSGYATSDSLVVSDATGTGAKLTPVIESGQIIGVTIIDGGRNYTSPAISVTSAGGSGATFEVTLGPAEAELVFTASAQVDGKETGIFRPTVLAGQPDITQFKGTYTFTIPAVDNAEFYNYYRSIIYPFPGQANIGVDLGWIGSSRATTFTDNNITPDFTRTPKLYYDPFVPGQIISAKVLSGGAGYSHGATITVSDSTGSGAVVYPVVLEGEIVGVYIANGGKGYTNPTFTVSGGSGATFSVQVSPATGTYPGVSFTFQQRAGYAATLNQPMTIWASRIEEPGNFSAAEVLDATDPYSYTLDSTRVSRIRHAIPVQQGLLIFTRDGVSLLRASEGTSVTALNGILDPQSYIGASEVPPVLAGEDILYVQEKSRGIRLLSFVAVARKFEGVEISQLSRHLFSGSAVRAMTMAMDSENRGYGVFDDGSGFIFTLNRNQQIFAFSPMTTQGILEDTVKLNVGTEEHVYFSVIRAGRRCIEYMRPYETETEEDMCILDARISTAKIFPPADLAASAASGDVTFTASAPVFSAADVGKLIFVGRGRGVVTEYVNPTTIVATMTREITVRAFQTEAPARAVQGTWWLNPLLSSVSGIPFEGQTVAVIGDGKRQTDKVVQNGAITLDTPAAIVHVGFPYRARLQTLPPPESEGFYVNIIGASVSYLRVGTMKLGVGEEAPFPQHRRTDEPWFEPTQSKPGERFAYLDGSWSAGGKIALDIDDGIHAEISRIVVFYNLGGRVYDPQVAARGVGPGSGD